MTFLQEGMETSTSDWKAISAGFGFLGFFFWRKMTVLSYFSGWLRHWPSALLDSPLPTLDLLPTTKFSDCMANYSACRDAEQQKRDKTALVENGQIYASSLGPLMTLSQTE